MTRPVSDIAFTPSVKAVQERLGSRNGYARMEQGQGWRQEVTPDLRDFLADLDTFFLATTNAEGQPYIQHRGGPPGFLKPIDDRTLGFADYSGNRQYITVGNLKDNPKAFIFLLDFARRRRVKLWGRASIINAEHKLAAQMLDPTYDATPERFILFHVEAWDINCPQHITQRFSAAEVEQLLDPLQARIDELETALQQHSSQPPDNPPFTQPS